MQIVAWFPIPLRESRVQAVELHCTQTCRLVGPTLTLPTFPFGTTITLTLCNLL